MESQRTIHVAHSPDSDDAFMFYALAEGIIDTGDLRFVHELEGIQSLNERAMKGELEVSAVSIHAYAYLTDRYLLLPHGASMGERYGPRLVSRSALDLSEVKKSVVAVPGKLTSAYLGLKLWAPEIRTVDVPFDEIQEGVAAGAYDVGLIIHEGQLTYGDSGLHMLLDLGEWWHEETGLPLPLGGNVIRRDLGDELIQRVSRLLFESIRYSLEHREAGMNYAMQFARGLEPQVADEFVGMYVNQRTLDYGADGRAAVSLFLEKGFEAGIFPGPVHVEFAEMAHASS
ncbi:MAG: MqnA/MqnD/SBP family protein [Gemmatimonadota bacterium]